MKMAAAQRSEDEFAKLAALLRCGCANEALPRLRDLAARAPAVGPAHGLLLEGLLATGARRDAATALDTALTLPAGSADALDMLAYFARQLDRHEMSRELYRRAAAAAPRDARQWYNLATSERALGDLRLAAEACDKALSADPDMRAALLLRSEVSRATVSCNHVDALRRRIADRPDAPDAMFLHYALGKELHDLSRYDEAFSAFASGAAARRRSLTYDVAVDEAKLRRIADVYAAPDKAAKHRSSARHVFIVGLPRSGTTLVERILGGLDGVRSNGETNNFAAALHAAAPARGGDIFERAAAADPARVAGEYEALAVPGGFAGTVVEKLPFNYLYLGAIAAALPDATIVSVERHPVDSCFAMYRTLFASAYPFSYDFCDLARYYAAYRALMAHWMRLFPGRMHVVDYDTLVHYPAATARALAARAGLAWDDAALDIAANRSASLTASAAQVREGISTRSSGIWGAYRAHLWPLVAALEDAGVAL